jgi:hypothetical protein
MLCDKTSWEHSGCSVTKLSAIFECSGIKRDGNELCMFCDKVTNYLATMNVL